MIAVWQSNIKNNKEWIGRESGADAVILTLQEPLTEKQNSFKSVATVDQGHVNGQWRRSLGKTIVYLKKDSTAHTLQYGSTLVIKRSPQEIRNTGNPGSFDYKRYCLFHDITHQVYLTSKDYTILPQTSVNPLRRWVFQCQLNVVSTFRRYIHDSKQQGLAEALLIGYTDELDKPLVQSFTNTGVVHIIAISGMHIGLIYGLLLFLTLPLRAKRLKLLHFILVILGLWLFTLIAGANASVMRSAVMFSAIALGTVLNKRASIYNNLALAAFALLIIDPFWLWDVGFQLSFLAVLSIVVFFQPIYNCLYVQNKLLDYIWKLCALSLAAQVLTTPISIFYFHQFPLLFLLANVLAVPLSSFIIYLLIVLYLTSFIPPVAHVVARVTEAFISLMVDYIERLNIIPYALWNNLSVSVLQTVLLYGMILCFFYWIIRQARIYRNISFACLLVFIAVRLAAFIEANNQHKLIVYNVSKYQAIDVVDGTASTFIGDDIVPSDPLLNNFNLKPSRVLNRIEVTQKAHDRSFLFGNKHILIIDSSIVIDQNRSRAAVDVLILSKNPRVYVPQLNTAFKIRQLIIDGSVPPWKAALWKKDCESLHIPCHYVVENGAYTLSL